MTQMTQITGRGLEFRDVSKSFGAVRAVTGVSFDVTEGDAHALIGENGAGKSTLLKILAGLVRPDAGELFWRGERLHVSSPREAIERGIGMVYQEMLSFPNLSVAGNIFAGRELCGPAACSRSDADARAHARAARSTAAADRSRRQGGVAVGGAPPVAAGGPRARLQVPGPGARRADHGADRCGGRSPVRRAARRCRRGARRSCTCRIGCPRCSACAIASRCCATARWWRPTTAPSVDAGEIVRAMVGRDLPAAH